MKQTELNFFTKLSVCDIQVRLQSRCMPKNLIFSVTVKTRLLYSMNYYQPANEVFVLYLRFNSQFVLPCWEFYVLNYYVGATVCILCD